MASRLVPRPHTLPNLRPIRRLSSAAGGGDGDGAAHPPSPFSDIKDRLRSAPSPPGRIPDLSFSPFPAGGEAGAARPPSPFSDIKDRLRSSPSPPGRISDLSFSPFPAGGEAGAARPPSPFSDIKDRLRSAPAPPRRLPDLPPPPPPPGPFSRDDIRKNLAQFRSKTPGAPSASAPPTLSFQQHFENNLLNNSTSSNPPSPAAPPPHTLSFGPIRDSLRKLQPGPPPAASPFSGFRNLRPPPVPAPAPASEPLPASIFDKKDDGPKAPKTKFLRMYDYGELGEKLRRLRPQGATATQFSLAELNDRLVKLRDLEEKEAKSRKDGTLYLDLRESIVSIQHKEAEKKASLNKLSILTTNLSGLPTPAFMLKDPQEELFERYNHPDHMSSAEKMKLELKKVRDEFKMSESDCGSTRVQVAQLTTKIKHLSSVLHKKDKHSRKGLQEMVQARKKLLKYLRRTDWDSYCFTLSKLGLRDTPEYKAPDYKAETKAKSKSKSKTKSKSKSKSKSKIKA